MKILFVFSGNKINGISPITQSQGRSLELCGMEVHYFPVKGKGIINYLRNLSPLRSEIRNNNYNIIHAHYSFIAVLTSLAAGRRSPIVVSLMGSDIEGGFFRRLLIRIFRLYNWKSIIVKSETLKIKLDLQNLNIIPNGVDLEIFSPSDKNAARKKLNLSLSKKYILFMADPNRPEKNFKLANEAISLLNRNDTELLSVFDVKHEIVPYYLNAVDVLLLTSLWEGSSNVVKEAMGCNCPVVSTDVGDIKEIIGSTDNCYTCAFSATEIAEKLKIILTSNRRTNGRENIRHLASSVISKRIIDLYKQVSNNSQ